ncbi:MAG: protein kinase [Spartobacteria bacterium]
MDNRIFLERYRLSRGRNGLPVELYRSPAARTYRAQEIETGREVALTLVSPAPNDGALLERLETEAHAAENINQVNIPRLYDFGRENDELVYVTEYCEGHTAAAWVAARGPLPVGAVLRVGLQVVDAMNATAFQRLHHSALNPDNIIFTAGQTVEGDWPPVKVLHWFAPPPDLSATGNERIDSAIGFAAPEQLQNGHVDVRSEIYSLGATMWFLLTGTPPAARLPGEKVAPAGLEKLRGVPKIVRHLLDRMLRLDPAERPHDPVALAAYLQTCLSRVDRRANLERRLGVPLLAKARVAVAKPPMPIPIKPLAWAAGILALAAFAIVFLPWPLSQKRAVPVAREAARIPESLPNEVAVVRNDSMGRMNDAGDWTSPAPAPVTSPLSAEEIPRDEMASTVTANTPVDEPAFPAEGPSEPVTPPPPAVAANQSEVQPAATALPEAESNDANETAPPVIAETNEAHEAAPLSAPPEPTPLAEEEPVQVAQSTPPPKKVAKISSTKRTTKKRTVVSKSERPTTHSAKSRRVAHAAKRAQPLPKIRVGSAQAELVGTTSDGKWILSVSESGRRIIVPPPPGYGE